MLIGEGGDRIHQCSAHIYILNKRPELVFKFEFSKFRYGVHRKETAVTCTAGVGTMLLEFGALSRITGKNLYKLLLFRSVTIQ